MTRTTFYPGFLWWLFLALFSPLVVVRAANIVVVAAGHLNYYIWFLVGIIVVFIVVDKLFVQGGDDTLRCFSHELNNAVVSLMLFKKVHSFHVEHDSGVAYHTAGGRLSTVLINLAPYCLPLFSYVILIVRAVMLPNLYWIVDIIIGITVGFYISVFRQQTGSHQTDISQYSHLLFPYWFIVVFWIFNAEIILYSFSPCKNVFLAFADTFVSYWHYIVDFINSLLK